MKRLLPGWTELGIFALLAIVCAAAAAGAGAQDVRMAGLAVPVFIFAAILGLRRSGQLSMREPVRPTIVREPAEAE